jgi:hypothetical protein
LSAHTRSSHLTLKQVHKLKAELDRLETFRRGDPEIDQDPRCLGGQMKYIATTALKLRKPIAT